MVPPPRKTHPDGSNAQSATGEGKDEGNVPTQKAPQRKLPIWVQIGGLVLVVAILRVGYHFVTKVGTTPQIVCPPEASVVGAAPPFGIKQYCVLDGNKKHGPSKTWWTNGEARSETNYKHDKKHGLSRRWHKNATMSAQGEYANGVKQGIWSEWNPKGQLTITTTFQDGYMHGPRYLYDTKGNVKEQLNYAAGVLVEAPEQRGESRKPAAEPND